MPPPLELDDYVVIYQRADEETVRMTSRMASAETAALYAEGLGNAGHRPIATLTVGALLLVLGVRDIPEMKGR